MSLYYSKPHITTETQINKALYDKVIVEGFA